MHRFTDTKGIELIKYFEGFSPVPYFCPGNHLTIGYGHKILPEESIDRVSKWQAEDILAKDLYKSERTVIKYIDNTLTDNQFGALVSFTFNLGGVALQRSTLRQKINFGLYEDCSSEFLKWIYVAGRKTLGLIKRRTAESNLFDY